MKLKSIVSAALLLSMTAGIAGCGLKRSEPDPTSAPTTPVEIIKLKNKLINFFINKKLYK